MILHDWRHQLYFSLHVKYQSYSYTRLIAEGIRASLGGIRSTPTSQTLHQQVTMALMGFLPKYTHHSIECTSYDTEPTYPIHMFSKCLKYRCYCNAVSQCNTPQSLASITFDITLSVIMVCLPVFFKLSGTKESSENRLCHR